MNGASSSLTSTPRMTSPRLTTELHKRPMTESGANYLKGSKVCSSTGYVTVAGTILGIPHGRRPQSVGTPRLRFKAMSEQAGTYREQPYCFASMDRKPLTPYDPNAFRSRLAVDDAPVPYKNSSTIEFNDGLHCCHKKRFTTTNTTFFTGEPCDPRTNPGVISASTRFKRTQQAK
mmetsp:Transcript_101557/g.262491  ORF Transcript_101557/g.262491 Transcript_101557/m.262491 type:complete len:175 (-) Transcript_101557:157-681(-)